ncbi:MAG: NifB/NifX family molybdenum-iron cluster-binding protein [Tenericutes bacterium]|nr:NifB/NifX family molybdenum-iron cluster-binding protein [Mycoplasmatota bacterium]
MIIALPTTTSGEKSFISEHFGRSNFFYIYNTETKTGEVYVNANKDGQGGVGVKSVEFILKHGTNILITPRVGEKAMNLLSETDVKIYTNTDEIVKENIASFLNGELKEL